MKARDIRRIRLDHLSLQISKRYDDRLSNNEKLGCKRDPPSAFRAKLVDFPGLRISVVTTILIASRAVNFFRWRSLFQHLHVWLLVQSVFELYSFVFPLSR